MSKQKFNTQSSIINLKNNVNNVGIGVNALKNFNNNKNYQHNTAAGINSLKEMKKGSYNTAIGSNTMKNSNGSNDIKANTAIGNKSMENIVGNFNTSIGFNSGSNIKKGNDNILIGTNSKTSKPISKNEIVIGNYAKGHGDNKATLGNNNTRNIQGKKNSSLGSKNKNFKTLFTNQIGVFHQDKRDKNILRDDNINLSSLKENQLPKGIKNKKYIKVDSKGNMTLVDLATILKNIN